MSFMSALHTATGRPLRHSRLHNNVHWLCCRLYVYVVKYCWTVLTIFNKVYTRPASCIRIFTLSKIADYCGWSTIQRWYRCWWGCRRLLCYTLQFVRLPTLYVSMRLAWPLKSFPLVLRLPPTMTVARDTTLAIVGLKGDEIMTIILTYFGVIK